MLRERLAHPGFGRENQQSFSILGDSQFLRRAEHSLRFDAAHFARLDGEGGLSSRSRQGAPRYRQRNLVADLIILCAANDLALALSVGHTTDRKTVRIRMFVAGENLGDDDSFKLTGLLLDALDFDPKHG